jgi:MFS family permease
VANDPPMARGGVFGHPVLRAILVAETISALGTQMTLLALPWFVLQITDHSATKLGLVLAVELLPAALLGIPSAVVVQRIGARRTLLYANIARAPLLAAIPVLYQAGRLPFSLLLAIVFAIGVFAAPYLSAQRLLLPETFPNSQSLVVQANAVVEGVSRLGMLIGPAIAGLAIGTLDAQNILYVNSVTFIVAFVIMWRRLPAGARLQPHGSAHDGQGVFAGARFALTTPPLRRITIAALLFGFFFPPLLASLPVLTHFRYGSDPKIAGFLYAAWGFGALIGTLTVLPAAKRIEPIKLAAIGAAGLAIPLWLLVVDLPEWQFALVLVISGLFTPVLNAPVITLMTLLAPTDVRAKVVTFILTMNLLIGPLAYALTGPMLDNWGVRPVYVFVAVGVSVASAMLVTLAFARRRDPDRPAVPA